jgi:hypothetical protein
VLARKPRAAELGHLVELYSENLWQYFRDPAAAEAMAASASGLPTIVHANVSASAIDKAELAAWTVVANVLLNLDETVTKG